ncbi:MAG: ABC transporter substrate-binding protein [Defluviitaleaceae bacterium]|nr:ABC transporter substrate-binding protein [Defluviitaleaceae bacterium]
MSIFKFSLVVTAAFAALAVLLSSCFQGEGQFAVPAYEHNTPTAQTSLTGKQAVLSRFPKYTANDNPPVDGGFLGYGLMTASPLRGMFHPVWAADTIDGWVGERLMDTVLSTGENLELGRDGMATFEADAENNTVVLTLRHDVDVRWHDGTPLTMYDLVFSYEILAHPDYDGARFGPAVTNVVGVCEYHSGTADHISGLVVSDGGRTLTKRFHALTPMNLYGSGMWLWPTARHHFEGISVADMSAHPHARHKMLGTGAFTAGAYIPGEGIQLPANQDYWQGAPRIAGINAQVIHPELVPFAMRSGRLDISAFSPRQFMNFSEPSNFTFLADTSAAYSYTGFRFGIFDSDAREVDMRPSGMDNVYVRRALAYAVDHDRLGRLLYGGLRFPAASVVPPFHAHVLDADVPGHMYNPERARRLLDEAGFTDTTGDGFRDNPDGSPLVITWAVMSGEDEDFLTQFKIQSWASIGLDVRLFQGRPLDFNRFYSYLEHDNDGGRIDMFDAAWSVGLAPDARQVWGHDTPLNFTRYTSPRFREILSRKASPKMWDEEYRRQVLSDWQWAFYEEIPAFPTLWRVEPVAVNNRVRNFSLARGNGTSEVSLGAWHLVELTRGEPY